MKPRPRTALIFGVSGQDGAYLAQSLLRRGFEVHGTSRDKENTNYGNLRRLGIYEKVTCHSAVLGDFRNVVTVIKNVCPAHIYNLAAQSSVGLSFEQPVETIDSIMHGTINIMEALRFLPLDARFYNAASSECFGNTEKDRPADETTTFRPRSPYAVGKAASFWAVANYREAYGLFACSGVLFNHESPLRPARFVTQKIVRGAMGIASRPGELAEPRPADAGARLGLGAGICRGHGPHARARHAGGFRHRHRRDQHARGFRSDGVFLFRTRLARHVVLNPTFLRPLDITFSSGNPSKAQRLLGWKAEKKMRDVVGLLVEAERQRARTAA